MSVIPCCAWVWFMTAWWLGKLICLATLLINSLTKLKVPSCYFFFYTSLIFVQTSGHFFLEFIMWEYMQKSFLVPSQIYLTYDGFCCYLQADHPKLNFKDKYSEPYRDAHPTAPVVVPWMSGVISAWATSRPAAQLIQLQQTAIQLFFSFCNYTLFFFFFPPGYIRCKSKT